MYCEIAKDNEKARIEVTCSGALPSESVCWKGRVKKVVEDAKVGLEIGNLPEDESSKQIALAPEAAIEADVGKVKPSSEKSTEAVKSPDGMVEFVEESLSASFAFNAGSARKAMRVVLMDWQIYSLVIHITGVDEENICVPSEFCLAEKECDAVFRISVAAAVQVFGQFRSRRIESKGLYVKWHVSCCVCILNSMVVHGWVHFEIVVIPKFWHSVVINMLKFIGA